MRTSNSCILRRLFLFRILQDPNIQHNIFSCESMRLLALDEKRIEDTFFFLSAHKQPTKKQIIKSANLDLRRFRDDISELKAADISVIGSVWDYSSFRYNSKSKYLKHVELGVITCMGEEYAKLLRMGEPEIILLHRILAREFCKYYTISFDECQYEQEDDSEDSEDDIEDGELNNKPCAQVNLSGRHFRLNRLIYLIKREQIGVDEYLNLFGLCRRYLTRDVGLLRQAGFDITYDVIEKTYSISEKPATGKHNVPSLNLGENISFWRNKLRVKDGLFDDMIDHKNDLNSSTSRLSGEEYKSNYYGYKSDIW